MNLAWFLIDATPSLGWKSKFEKMRLDFLQNNNTLSDDFNVVGSSFQMHGAATEKACLAISSFRNRKSSGKADDLSCLGMVDRFSTVCLVVGFTQDQRQQ